MYLVATPVSSPRTRAHGGLWRQALFWIGTPVATFALGIFGASLHAPGLLIAPWWPAAGVSLWFALRARPEHRVIALLLVFVSTSLANAATGRPFPLCIIYGALNTLEIALILTGIRAWRSDFRLVSLTSAARFVISVLASSALFGVAISLTGVLLLSADFLPTAIIAFASHSSAIMLIASFAMLPPRRAERMNPLEFIAHTVVAAVAIFIAFGPVANAPLAFLVFAVLVWGALRFPMEVALTQSLVVAAVVLTLVLSQRGSFAGGEIDALETAVTLVTFMSTIGLFTVLVVASRYEGRISAEIALNAANEIAEAERERAAALGLQLDLERQREDFVTATSHELRTPATNILGYSELLVGADLPDEPADWSRAVHRSATRLKLLLDDLHQSAGMAGTAIEPVSVDAIIADVRAAHLPDADARGTAIETPTQSGLTALASAIDARRALWGLVSNAVKFGGDGRVVVTARRDGATVVVAVEDAGPGMSPDTLANAFDRFYRGAEAEAASAAGLGLGLANARELARRNHGDVVLDSRPGHGTIASLVLPLAD